jgi:hypothetical protein
MKKINIKVGNIAGWPDQGMLYIGNGTEVPPGVYAFKRGVSEGDNPTPIMITKYKNRVKLSKKTIEKIERGM